MTNKRVWTVTCTFFIAACSANVLPREGVSQPPLRPPASVAITPDRVLLHSEALSSLKLAAPAGGEGFSEGMSTTKNLLPGGTSSAVIISGKVSPGNPSSGVAFNPTVVDATQSTSIQVTITADLDPRSVPGCTLLAPFSGVACSFPRFKIASGDLESGPLQASVYSRNDPTNTVVASNEVPSTAFKVRQITQLRGDEGKDDVSAMPSAMVYNKKLFFVGANSLGADKLFSYADSTKTVEQITNTLGQGTSDHPVLLRVYANRLFFVAQNSASHVKLASFDDRDGSLQQISDTSPGKGDGIETAVEFNGALYFTAQYSGEPSAKLCRYVDESESVELLTQDGVSGLAVLGNRLYFVVSGPDSKPKLAFLSANQKITKETGLFGAGAGWSEASVYYHGKAVLPAQKAQGVQKLFIHDPVKNSFWMSNTREDAAQSDDASGAIVYNDKVFFRAKDRAGFFRLFSYSDQPAEKGGGLRMVSRLMAAGDDLLPQPMAVLFNRLYFIGNGPGGASKVFEYDEASGNIRQVSSSDASGRLFVYDNKLFFSGLTPKGVKKLHMFDPASGVLALVSNTRKNMALGDDPQPVVIYANKLFFTALGSGGGRKLFSVCNPIQGCKP